MVPSSAQEGFGCEYKESGKRKVGEGSREGLELIGGERVGSNPDKSLLPFDPRDCLRPKEAFFFFPK